MDPATSVVATQFGGAAACAYLLNIIQQWNKVPWITEHTQGINRIVRAVLALVATIGISWAWSSGVAGSHILQITIPSGHDLIFGAWHWFTQYAMTQVAGNMLVPKTASAPPQNP